MNLLLLRATEVDDLGIARLSGRRARHLNDVLGVQAGRFVRAGLLDGPTGAAEVLERSDQHVVLRCRLDAAPPPPGRDVLMLAVPRPKVLRRCLSDAAALGYGRIVLFRSWRVDKSHLSSRALQRDVLEASVVAGLEQARRTHVPRVDVFDRFRPFVEDRCDAIAPPGARWIANPDASDELGAHLAAPLGAFALAVGPERGFTDYEIDAFGAHGFRAVRLGAGADHPLRVEAAVVALTAQLRVLRGAPSATVL